MKIFLVLVILPLLIGLTYYIGFKVGAYLNYEVRELAKVLGLLAILISILLAFIDLKYFFISVPFIYGFSFACIKPEW